jgi:hypothetical protein
MPLWAGKSRASLPGRSRRASSSVRQPIFDREGGCRFARQHRLYQREAGWQRLLRNGPGWRDFPLDSAGPNPDRAMTLK